MSTVNCFERQVCVHAHLVSLLSVCSNLEPQVSTVKCFERQVCVHAHLVSLWTLCERLEHINMCINHNAHLVSLLTVRERLEYMNMCINPHHVSLLTVCENSSR